MAGLGELSIPISYGNSAKYLKDHVRAPRDWKHAPNPHCSTESLPLVPQTATEHTHSWTVFVRSPDGRVGRESCASAAPAAADAVQDLTPLIKKVQFK